MKGHGDIYLSVSFLFPFFASVFPSQEEISGSYHKLARALTLVENGTSGYEKWLAGLNINNSIPVIGITGPPGAGKSTLVNSLVSVYLSWGKKVAVVAVDPSSPFNLGSLLGDRIRMSDHYNNPNVFIRSMATRGFLGGLSAKTVEVTDVLKAAGFDIVIVETVGVGQSEVEIAGLADVTVLVLVPEAGDDVQGIKSGIMEIADIFAVNKSDRPGAEAFLENIRRMIRERNKPEPENSPIAIAIIATANAGIEELAGDISHMISLRNSGKRRIVLLADKAWQLIQSRRMADISKNELRERIESSLAVEGSAFNLYRFIGKF